MGKLLAALAVFIASLAFGAGVGALVAFVVMKLWNFAAVPAFHAPVLGFLQTWALILLVGFVVGLVRRARK